MTDWEIFHHGSLDVEINDYINFGVQLVVPDKEVKMYPNNKSYITKRKAAFRNKEIIAHKETEKELKTRLKDAK